jgi:hypothetical protein
MVYKFMDTCGCKYLWYKGYTNFQRRKKIMRNYYNQGGPTLTKAQKTLPKELQKLIKGKKKKEKKPSMMAQAIKGKR